MKESWGNTSLPNLSTEDLLRPDVNKIVANRRKARDIEWQEKQRQGLAKLDRETWTANQRRGMAEKRSQGTWQQNVREGAKKREAAMSKGQRLAVNKKTRATDAYKAAHRQGCADKIQKPQNLSHCEHCDRVIDNANYRRWHGPNCRHKK